MGNLHYPAHTSAKILFGEVVEFQARNPGVDIQYHCVVYDQKTYQEFQKEFTKKMSNPPPQRKVASLLFDDGVCNNCHVFAEVDY